MFEPILMDFCTRFKCRKVKQIGVGCLFCKWGGKIFLGVEWQKFVCEAHMLGMVWQ